MRKVGFSTGALAYADFRRGLQLLRETGAQAVELSVLRVAELDPLVEALGALDLDQFSFISVHAPSAVDAQHERQVVEKLQGVAQRGWPIVVHPDSIHDDSLWRPFGKLICIENMDKRKPLARTRHELAVWFDRLPEASLCLDLAHVRQIDPTMTEAYLILRDFGDRLAEVHLSEVNAASKHEPISYGATLAYRQVASLIPESIPVILESIISAEFIDDEIEAAHEALATDGPRPRVRNRRSATPRPPHA
jgi:endonuclease IV